MNNLLDGVFAKDYYNDLNAENYIVNPNDGKRFSDNKTWGLYKGSSKKSLPSHTWLYNKVHCTYWSWQDYYGWTPSSLHCYSKDGRMFVNGDGNNAYTKQRGTNFWNRCSCYDVVGWH